MVERVSLRNFKGFKELPSLDVKPITILCGANSCGKSSILQSLLLLKQTFESQTPSQTLLLNGRLVRLGTFKDIVYQKKINNHMVFDFCFKVPRDTTDLRGSRGRRPLPLQFLLRDFLSEDRNPEHRKAPALQSTRNVADFIFHYKVSLKGMRESANNQYLRPVIVETLEFGLDLVTKDQQTIPQASVSLHRKEGDLYSVNWKNVQPRYARTLGRENRDFRSEADSITARVEFSNLSPQLIFSEPNWEDGQRRVPVEVSYLFRTLHNIMQRILGVFTYVGPLREEPARRYIYSDEVIEVGIKGENAPYIFLTERDRPIGTHYFYDRDTQTFERKDLDLGAAVQDWLSLMNINKLQPERIQEIVYLNLNAGVSEKTRVSVADVGFGVSQVFPILLEGLRMPKGGNLLLEQPEIHLHPKLQMQMADYFIALALSNKRVIVETHSDHIVNRLVRRIVEDDTGHLKNLVGVYFISQGENGSMCEEVVIDDTRGIVNWPVDFFDQTASEQEQILRAGLKKRRRARIQEVGQS